MFLFDNIHSLVEKGDLQKVEKFLEKKPDAINQMSKSKGIPINIAIQKVDISMFGFLISKGAKIDDYSLTYAIETKSIEMLELVFKQGANANSKAMYAYRHGWDVDVKFAITEVFFIYDLKKEKDNHENYCKTVIDIALKNGLKINKALSFDILNCATKKSTDSVINYLYEKGFKNEFNSKMLGEAISECNVGLVKTIVKDNPQLINKKAIDNETPLEWTFTCMSIKSQAEDKLKLKEIAAILISNNADVNIPNNIGRTSFFKYSWQMFYNTGKIDSNDELIKQFLSKSTNPRANILYKELLKGNSSKAPVVCNSCKENFILQDLANYRYILKNKSLTVKCPHCKGEASNLSTGIIFADDEEWIKMEN